MRNYVLHYLASSLVTIGIFALAGPVNAVNSPYPLLYPISNSDFTLFYKAIPLKDFPIDVTVLTSTLNSYLLTVIYPAMIERGADARMVPPEDAYVKDLVAIRFERSFTAFYPDLSDIEIMITGMKGAALDPRYKAVEEANIAVFKGGVSRNVVAGISLTVFPLGSNSSLSDTGSSDVDVA